MTPCPAGLLAVAAEQSRFQHRVEMRNVFKTLSLMARVGPAVSFSLILTAGPHFEELRMR